MGMTEYTEWCVQYPWHVSDVPVPDDCTCDYCCDARRAEFQERLLTIIEQHPLTTEWEATNG